MWLGLVEPQDYWTIYMVTVTMKQDMVTTTTKITIMTTVTTMYTIATSLQY